MRANGMQTNRQKLVVAYNFLFIIKAFDMQAGEISHYAMTK